MAQDTLPESAVKGDKRPLTTTSFAILGLLSVRRWSAYELTAQMKRGLRYSWPRTETRLYQEPKNLVAHRLATARSEATGRRRRTVYAITPAGRRALARWLDEPSAPPQAECEAVLRATFADAGTNDALIRTLHGLAAHADTIRQQLADQAADYVATGGPFPERLHLIALVGKYLSDYAELLDGWATWAETTVSDWAVTGPASAVRIPDEIFDLVLERAGRARPTGREPTRGR